MFSFSLCLMKEGAIVEASVLRLRCTFTASRIASRLTKEITAGWSGEAERVEEEGGDAVWRGCSSSGPRTPCTPVLSLPLRPHPDTGHRHEDTQSYESGSIPALYWSSILHRLAIQYSAINTTSLSLTSTTAKS